MRGTKCPQSVPDFKVCIATEVVLVLLFGPAMEIINQKAALNPTVII